MFATKYFGPLLPLLITLMAGCTQVPSQSTLLKAPQVAVLSTQMAMRVPANMGGLQLAVSLKLPTSSKFSVMSAEALADWFEDIDRMTFTIEGKKLKAPITAVIKRSEFLNNKAVLQVNNLPPGDITIHSVALRADGTTIIEANGKGTVTANHVTGISMVCEPMPTPEGGHIRIEMDCWSTGDCDPSPTPQPSAFVPVPLDIVKFQSTADPHEEGGNGIKFDNYLTGTFLALRTLTGDFILEKHHGLIPNGKWAGKPVNNAVAVKTGNDVFLYYVYGKRASFNGRAVTLKDKESLSGTSGMSVVRNGAQYTVKSAMGDVVTIRDKDSYLDLVGTVSGDRVVHEVSGSLGTYNNQTTTEALRLRNGQVEKDLKRFLTDWMVKPEEDLFPASEPFIPANYVMPGSSPTPAPTATSSAAPTATPSVTPTQTPSPAATK